jgi:hypothetical protein
MARTKKFSKSKEEKELDYVKANRRGSREAELENSTGFKSGHSAHKNKKQYCRKPKHKENWEN